MFTIRRQAVLQGGSLIVVLPRFWTENLGLKAHDELVLEVDETQLVVHPLQTEKRQKRPESRGECSKSSSEKPTP
jgi:antitoxin component of MazEF toxin-antitoxin module